MVLDGLEAAVDQLCGAEVATVADGEAVERLHPCLARLEAATTRAPRRSTPAGSGLPTLMAADLRSADVPDPDLADQHLSPARALRELGPVRAVTLSAGERRVRVVTGRSATQAQALAALGVDTSGWSRAQVA